MKRLQNYVKDSFAELSKVTWLSRNQAIKIAMIVLGVCAVVSAFLVVIDLGFSELSKFVISKIN